MAEAIVRWLVAQRIVLDDDAADVDAPLFPGVFGIFGHGNVTCLGLALEAVQDELPTWRGQNEQGMALAAVAYAKTMRRRQIMVATSSVGPGALNMVTAAGVAMANRLPVLLLAGDTFQSRIPDPVLQQVEHFGSPSTTVNDAFRSTVRFWDRITHPAQILSSLPQALAMMLDPSDCGPAFIALPQDVQAEAFDYPEAFFARTVHRVPRPRPSVHEVDAAVAVITQAKRPLIIAGGGVHASHAEQALADFATQHNIPVVETVAGKSCLLASHPNYAGPIGVTGSDAANNLAAVADVVIAIGCRLQDFTTGSWTIFQDENVQFVGINTARFDAIKHRATAVVGDALEVLQALQPLGTYGRSPGLVPWKAPVEWLTQAQGEVAGYHAYIDGIAAPYPAGDEREPTYAQVVGVVDRMATPDDFVLTAAGGFPGELNNGWRSKAVATFDCEYGFSCMGYEISGAWGAAMARRAQGSPGDVFAFVGDGSYLMMNSDLYASVLSGHKFILIVCDNGGYAVINRLQVNQGGNSFNNLLEHCNIGGDLVRVDFAAHAASMGCRTETVQTIDELEAAIGRARNADRTSVIALRTDAFSWTGGGAFWEVGVPEVSNRAEVRAARESMDIGKKAQTL
jgi:3D-(3,5/4)-trihydroxycyclohexane-1,2-dione acylhydrolase (decyclizing)